MGKRHILHESIEPLQQTVHQLPQCPLNPKWLLLSGANTTLCMRIPHTPSLGC